MPYLWVIIFGLCLTIVGTKQPSVISEDFARAETICQNAGGVDVLNARKGYVRSGVRVIWGICKSGAQFDMTYNHIESSKEAK